MTAPVRPMPSYASSPEGDVLRFLTAWLGIWPAAERLRIAPSSRRVVPGWDGSVLPLAGVAADERFGHATAISVSPLRLNAVRRVVDELVASGQAGDRRALAQALPAAVGHPERVWAETALRWTAAPGLHRNVGEWRSTSDPDLPDWLRPFAGLALAAFGPHGEYMAGVGIKQHNFLGHELTVVTEPAYRGRGLATALVAQAAAKVLANGALPLYRHDLDNYASARVAEAAGFSDGGWRWIELVEEGPRPLARTA